MLRGAGRGLTLVELLVVMFILVALTTVTLQAAGTRISEARYDVSVQRLNAIERAIRGDGATATADRAAIAGFVSDIGRLPSSLDELLDQGSLPAFQLHSQTVDGRTFRLGAGWRGPYLRLPLGVNALSDGFGKTFQAFDAGDIAVGDAGYSDPITRVQVNADRPEPFDAALSIDLSELTGSDLPVRLEVLDSGSVSLPPVSTDAYEVTLHEPSNGAPSARSMTADSMNGFEVVFPTVTAGRRYLTASQTTGGARSGLRLVHVSEVADEVLLIVR